MEDLGRLLVWETGQMLHDSAVRMVRAAGK